MSDLDDLMQDAAEVASLRVPDDHKLTRVAELAAAVRRVEAEVEHVEQVLAQKQRELRNLVERDLPDAMRDIGLESFTLGDGTQVALKNEVYAGISEQHRTAALTWLRDHGYGDLIRNEVKVNFGSGEDSKASALQDFLRRNGTIEFSERSTVLPQTLKAFIKEQDQRGVAVPDDLFSVHRATVAKFAKRKRS